MKLLSIIATAIILAACVTDNNDGEQNFHTEIVKDSARDSGTGVRP